MSTETADQQSSLGRNRIVIVGGVAGGASAAARARRCDSNAEITILEKGPAASFANCGLPYHIGGEIAEREKLIVASADLFWERFRIRVRTGHEVIAIDRDAQTVTGRKVEDGEEFKLPYDRLILSTGSTPVRPGFQSVESENVFSLWTLDDMDSILQSMKRRPSGKAVVIGAGFVGLEIAEQLVEIGMRVAIVQKSPQVLNPLDAEMAKLVERELSEKGVELYLYDEVQELLIANNRCTAVKLKEESIATELVIVAAGVRPRTELAVDSGLPIGETGGVLVNEYCQTEDPRVYAVGDMVEYKHQILDRTMRVPLAGPANKAGRIAGAHAAGGPCKPMPPVLGTSIVRVFEVAAGMTGLNARQCDLEGMDHRVATIQAAHHASYFPGARGLTLKIVYTPTGKLLGAQAVGPDGIDKRIDVLATLISQGGSVDDLADLDLAYAPPFGSAKDPVHMAAFAAQNDLEKFPELIGSNADLSAFQVVDVRAAKEFKKLPPVKNAVCIPVDELHERYGELDPDRETVTICHSGKRAHVAACLLRGLGFKRVCNLNGGMSIRSLLTATPSTTTTANATG
ncbi:MAG: FAD-dependent oxidoreductase [Pirellulaceae bacterium]